MTNQAENDVVNSSQRLPFEIIAVPQNKFPQQSAAGTEPVNIKIKITNKEEIIKKHGVISLPKLTSTGSKRLRLVSSDQTIISFDLVMEANNVKNVPKKPYKILHLFKPSGCLNIQNDDDVYCYAPTSSKDKHRGKSPPNLPESNDPLENKVLDQKFALRKNLSPISSENKALKTPRNFLGKCKPGGCLDPPFSEEKYVYKPNGKMLSITHKNLDNNHILNDKSMLAETRNIENVDAETIKVLPNTNSERSSVASDDDYFHSLITYPPTVTSKEILNIEEIRNKKPRTRISSENKVRVSVNEFSETYFIPPKQDKISSSVTSSNNFSRTENSKSEGSDSKKRNTSYIDELYNRAPEAKTLQYTDVIRQISSDDNYAQDHLDTFGISTSITKINLIDKNSSNIIATKVSLQNKTELSYAPENQLVDTFNEQTKETLRDSVFSIKESILLTRDVRERPMTAVELESNKSTDELSHINFNEQSSLTPIETLKIITASEKQISISNDLQDENIVRQEIIKLSGTKETTPNNTYNEQRQLFKNVSNSSIAYILPKSEDNILITDNEQTKEQIQNIDIWNNDQNNKIYAKCSRSNFESSTTSLYKNEEITDVKILRSMSKNVNPEFFKDSDYITSGIKSENDILTDKQIMATTKNLNDIEALDKTKERVSPIVQLQEPSLDTMQKFTTSTEYLEALVDDDENIVSFQSRRLQNIDVNEINNLRGVSPNNERSASTGIIKDQSLNETSRQNEISSLIRPQSNTSNSSSTAVPVNREVRDIENNENVGIERIDDQSQWQLPPNQYPILRDQESGISDTRITEKIKKSDNKFSNESDSLEVIKAQSQYSMLSDNTYASQVIYNTLKSTTNINAQIRENVNKLNIKSDDEKIIKESELQLIPSKNHILSSIDQILATSQEISKTFESTIIVNDSIVGNGIKFIDKKNIENESKLPPASSKDLILSDKVRISQEILKSFEHKIIKDMSELPPSPSKDLTLSDKVSTEQEILKSLESTSIINGKTEDIVNKFNNGSNVKEMDGDQSQLQITTSKKQTESGNAHTRQKPYQHLDNARFSIEIMKGSETDSHVESPNIRPEEITALLSNKVDLMEPLKENESQSHNYQLELNLGFYTALTDQNKTTIKTFETSNYDDSYPENNTKILKSVIPSGNEIKISLNSEIDLAFQIKKTKEDRPLTSIPDAKLTETERILLKDTLLEEALNSVYKSLVPVQNIIQNLKDETKLLAQQQTLLKDMLNKTKTKPVRVTRTNFKCSCYNNLFQ